MRPISNPTVVEQMLTDRKIGRTLVRALER